MLITVTMSQNLHSDHFSNVINARFENIEKKLDNNETKLDAIAEKLASIPNGKTIHNHDIQLALLNAKGQSWSRWVEIIWKVALGGLVSYLCLRGHF